MIYDDLQRCRQAHLDAIEQRIEIANELAQKEYEFDMAYAAQIAAFRADGMPATLVGKAALGTDKVAQAKQALTIVEKGTYKAADARVQATYLDWKLAEKEYDREWASGGYNA